MKKIVYGSLYDTDKSELICEYEFSNPSDSNHVYEALYKSPYGQYFIAYSGGADSKYCVSCGQNRVICSSGIRLVVEDEAKQFTEELGTAEDFVKAFGETSSW